MTAVGLLYCRTQTRVLAYSFLYTHTHTRTRTRTRTHTYIHTHTHTHMLSCAHSDVIPKEVGDKGKWIWCCIIPGSPWVGAAPSRRRTVAAYCLSMVTADRATVDFVVFVARGSERATCRRTATKLAHPPPRRWCAERRSLWAITAFSRPEQQQARA